MYKLESLEDSDDRLQLVVQLPGEALALAFTSSRIAVYGPSLRFNYLNPSLRGSGASDLCLAAARCGQCK